MKEVKLRTKQVLGLLLAPLLWLFNSCSPIGDAVDKDRSNNYYFGKGKKDIFYSRGGNWFALGKTALNADVPSFKVLGAEIARDKNHLYYQSVIVDASSLDMKSLFTTNGPYADNLLMDKNGVFYIAYEKTKDYAAIAKPIKNADPNTFQRKDFNWANDHQNWYYRNQLIAVHYDSFDVLSEFFSKDRSNAYYHYGDVFQDLEAHYPTFDIMEHKNYAMDKETVYFMNYDATDNFKNTKVIKIVSEGQKPKFLSEVFLTIGEKVYCNGNLLDITTSEAEVVGEFYLKNKSKVYYFDQLLEDADATTFTENEKGFIGDTTSFYRGTERFRLDKEK
ncbi:Membrane protein [Croceitalea dokdonensis DOKDO 023]|uniref:Membrane protein n=1 Tax=Croceitalea dokdonensis DOKDO 023 TaxID=1300341 RepID=A0A0P7ACW2_9FLAO|nr:DKNYY domain-containing protein [Croceitalea dokdonensis]KPM30314.1 Membrane protein [Croceitalea dokdonensis DOKDO 023]